MSSGNEISSSDFVLKALEIIWTPGIEALKLQKELNVRSLEDTAAAAERAGYAVCYADLPMKVSEFAAVIAGKPIIVVNRAKSPQHRQYTVPHELGHHVLHLNPSRQSHQLISSSEDGMAEFQAHMFAATWVIWVADDEEREDVLKQNPESALILFSSVFMSLGIILISLIVYLWPRLFRARLPGLIEKK